MLQFQLTIIVGGVSNTSSGAFSGILGGKNNNINNHTCSFIIGADITSTANCTTFVNNLNISGSITHGNAADGFIILTHVSESLNFADDTAAAAGGVPLGGLYRSGNVISIRIE